MMGTSVMKELRRSSPIILQKSVLTSCKAEFASFFLFFFLFSIWVFFQEYSRFRGQQGKEEAISLYPFYHLHSLHRHLDGSLLPRAHLSVSSLRPDLAGNDLITVFFYNTERRADKMIVGLSSKDIISLSSQDQK